MAGKAKDKPKVYARLRNKFRLLVINDDTFEEKLSLILSPLNVFTWGGAILLVLIALVASVIAFTPLRELIPGYSDPLVRKQAITNAFLTDSLQRQMQVNSKQLDNIKAIMEGRAPDSLEEIHNNSGVNHQGLNIKPSKADSMLRKRIEEEEKYNIAFSEDEPNANDIGGFFFFTPLKGLVSSSFDLSKSHFGVDIIAPKNEAIKAVLNGTVILATWTSETGHVIQLQHENNLISIYKHNSVLLKKEGETVKAGEVVAIIGESGELISGPHLHFELWYNGKPVNPQDYMIF